MIEKTALYAGEDEYGRRVLPLHVRENDAVFEKTASELLPEVARFIDRLRPRVDVQYVLVNALGAGEYYGSNANADHFPEAALVHAPDPWTGTPEVDRVRAASWPYGYPTFYGAKVFLHHRNTKDHPHYGGIELAAWNPRMKRVELVLAIEKELCERHGGVAFWDRVRAGSSFDVSMGCFPAGTHVTMADGTRKSIELVEVGERVITHLGRARRVTRVCRRPYAGRLIRVRAEAHETLACTENHPFWAVPRRSVKAGRYFERWQKQLAVDAGWRAAHQVEGDILLEPVVQGVVTPDYATREFCRLLGYYVAEGHVLRGKDKEPIGVAFSTHRDDAIHKEIEGLCAVFGTRNAPVTSARGASSLSRTIEVFDRRLAELCLEHGGAYAKKKRFSESVLLWHPDAQRELLGAYLNGDGCAVTRGAVSLSTASDYLAWQWMAILPRLGVLASIQNLEHKAGSGFSAYNTYEWVIHIGAQWAQGLRDVCAKIRTHIRQKAKNSRRIVDGYVLTPVRRFSEETWSGEVFNLEVEEDASFLAAGLAVHNSRVPFDTCALHLDWKRYRAAQAMFDPAKGHRTPADAVLAEHKRDPIPGVAVTRKEYCDEMRTRPNAVLPDGRKVFVYNDYPKFFDISGVFVGADRTAKDLLKIAAAAPARRGWAPGADLSTPAEGEKTAAAGKAASQSKRSEIVKGISAGEAARIVPGLARRDRDLSDRALHAIARSPEVGLTTAGGLGIVLRPREFQRVMMLSIGLPLEAAALDRAGSTFSRCPDCGADPLFPRMDPGLFSPLLARLLAPEAADRSMLGPSIERRVIVLSGTPPTPPKKALPPAKLASVELSGLLEKIAAAYAGYRARLPDVVAHAPFLMERVGVSELSKVACLEFTELFTPVSAAYLKRAFNDEA